MVWHIQSIHIIRRCTVGIYDLVVGYVILEGHDKQRDESDQEFF